MKAESFNEKGEKAIPGQKMRMHKVVGRDRVRC